MKFKLLASAGAAVMMSTMPAQAQKGVDYERGSTKNLGIPTCQQPIGSVSIINGEGRGWYMYQLGEPSTLIKAFVSRSGCFTMVDRGAGLSALQQELALAQGGNLQAGSNVGGAQVKTADYIIVADIAGADSNSGGSALGGAAGVAGGLIGGGAGRAFGGVLGGMRTKRVEAQTVLQVVNTRTTEVAATAEGSASKKDVSFGGVGGYGFAGAIGGGYEDTDIGKVVTYAFMDAYRQIVGQLGGIPMEVRAEEAPIQSFKVRKKEVMMYTTSSQEGDILRDLEKGMHVFPTGEKDGLMWEVKDENGNVGWVDNTKLKPVK